MEVDNKTRKTKSTGDGPVDATFNAIKELTGYNARLQLYQVHAVTEGTDAQAAYINALNKMLVKREKTAPSALSA